MPQMTDSAGSQLKKYGTGLKSRPIYVKLRPHLESRVTLLFIFVYQLFLYHKIKHQWQKFEPKWTMEILK